MWLSGILVFWRRNQGTKKSLWRPLAMLDRGQSQAKSSQRITGKQACTTAACGDGSSGFSTGSIVKLHKHSISTMRRNSWGVETLRDQQKIWSNRRSGSCAKDVYICNNSIAESTYYGTEGCGLPNKSVDATSGSSIRSAENTSWVITWSRNVACVPCHMDRRRWALRSQRSLLENW